MFIGIPLAAAGVASLQTDRPLHDLRREYTLDLGYRKPAVFDLRKWRHFGVYVFPRIQAGSRDLVTFQRLRRLSRYRRRLVFVVLSPAFNELVRKTVDQNKHVVLHLCSRRYYRKAASLDPSVALIVGSRVFTRISEILRFPKSLWQIPEIAVDKRRSRR